MFYLWFVLSTTGAVLLRETARCVGGTCVEDSETAVKHKQLSERIHQGPECFWRIRLLIYSQVPETRLRVEAPEITINLSEAIQDILVLD